MSNGGKIARVGAVEKLPTTTGGSVMCSHCGHQQSADVPPGELPVADYAVRCNACGNPLAEPIQPSEEG